MKPLFPSGLTDKDWMQIDTNASSPHANAIYISVSQFDSSETNTAISVTHSFDGGSTWKTVQVDSEQFFPNIDQFATWLLAKMVPCTSPGCAARLMALRGTAVVRLQRKSCPNPLMAATPGALR